MPHRIEVSLKIHLQDSLGLKIAKQSRQELALKVSEIRSIKAYLIDIDLSPEKLEAIAKGPLSDPVTQIVSIDYPLAIRLSTSLDFPWNWLIEVGFKPGVTDNEGRTAKEILELFLGSKLGLDKGVYTANQYCIQGELTYNEVRRLSEGLLANDLIHRTIIVPRDMLVKMWSEKKNLFYVPPKVKEQSLIEVKDIDLFGLADEDLIAISKDRVLALNLQEMKVIREYFQRPEIQKERAELGLAKQPTDLELEALAQTWSEHCKHKIFNSIINFKDNEKGEETIIKSLFDTYIQKGTNEIRRRLGADDWCLSVFKDNAGVIRFNDRYNIVFKVETHNSPSALDPYGGALTGIVGVNRDPFGTGMGAKLIFNTNVFCFAPPDYNKPLPKGLLHPKRIFEGVREGVEHGGNKSGIPTVNGSVIFDERYLGKPLVFCGTGGIMPHEICTRPSQKKRAQSGDAIVMCGGRIGKDGIHGATFSSEELHEGSPATAVQIGDPITQKKMTDFLLRARDLCLYNSITDNGAGGLSSSVGEMARETNGFELHLDRAPLKYPGLQPWEILLSEAQERMTVAVPQDRLEDFLVLAEKMDVEASVLGNFTNSGKFHCLYQGKTVAYLNLDFVHTGLPRLELDAVWTPPRHPEPEFPEPLDLGEELKALLSRYNVCSKEYVVRQYDHEVQGGSVIKPLTGSNDDGPSDAAVLRPDLASFEGLVVAHGICPRYSDIDTFHMVCCAVDEAVRNAISVGGNLNLMAGLDNFCWCDPIQSEKTPDGLYKLAQLVRANRALYQICTMYGIPCISGKDSMKNDANVGGTKISIPPTLLFSVVSRIKDVRSAVTMDAKHPGDLVYVLGKTYPELGASEYYARYNYIGNNVPKVRMKNALARYQALSDAMDQGCVSSCHDCSDGGLGVSLAEVAFSGNVGMRIDLGALIAEDVDRVDTLLFSESQSRFVVTVKKEHQKPFEDIMGDTDCALVGEVTQEPLLMLKYSEKIVVNESLHSLKYTWKRPLAW